jgi:hypothetical protein
LGPVQIPLSAVDRIIVIGSDMMANLAEARCAGLNGGGIGYRLCRTLFDHLVGDV